MRVGIGYDIHKLADDRDLILGGVKIPFSQGLEGHSDADVLTHAVMDALLGAAGLRDIGVQFPPDDLQYKDISSLKLLLYVKDKIADAGYNVGNIDATILADAPRLADIIEEMRKNISSTLAIDISQVMIKATTNEGMDAVGSGKAIAAFAAVLLE